MAHTTFRKDLSMPSMLSAERRCFDRIPDPISRCKIPLTDHLMCGIAVFGLKFPSLLQFDQGRNNPVIRHNLKALYGVENAPCDTYLRQRGWMRLSLGICAKPTAACLLYYSAAKADYTVFGEHYLLSVEGTGQYSSKGIHCAQCCHKEHRNGETSYYHELLGAVLVHPQHKEMFPLMPEAITQRKREERL